MSTSTFIFETRGSHARTRLAGYLELTKPRITALVLLTVAAGAVVAGPPAPTAWLLLHTLLGTALVAASTSALNQWLERDSDAVMPRTAGRVIPAGRLSAGEVVGFGLVTLLVGVVYLAWCVNALTAWLGLLTWALYVWVYTPLKQRTTFNTVIGAVAGALPTLMGWAATGTQIGLEVAALFMVLYLWQFPHFMAIAWRYRHEYARAGIRVLPSVDLSGRAAGRQAVMAAAMLTLVGALPALIRHSDISGRPLYFAWSLLLGLVYLGFSVRFALRRNDATAQGLLRASLVYLPALLALWILLSLSPLMTD